MLTDPANLLDSGIEIEASPGRKRVQAHVAAVGRRALAAPRWRSCSRSSRARPSPFYLMDEVEAALDDVNLHRFLDLVDELRTEAQLLIVTHQKRTMEIADDDVRHLDEQRRHDEGRRAATGERGSGRGRCRIAAERKAGPVVAPQSSADDEQVHTVAPSEELASPPVG